MTQLSDAFQAALQVTQQAVWTLAKAAGAKLPSGWDYPEDCQAVQYAKDILWHKDRDLFWSKDKDVNLNHLSLLFDQVHLCQGQKEGHYWPATYIKGIKPQIPYPRKGQPIKKEIEILKRRIQRIFTLERLTEADWENLSLLTLIVEKFGSYISLGNSDIALVDIVRSTGAVAAALANNTEAGKLSLIAGDLSGIQKFIYTITSAGALKSLRARSFYLELVTEEVVQQLLTKLQLPRLNVIYAGGGNLYLLAQATKTTKNEVEQVRLALNKWLLEQFQGKVFLALDCLTFDANDVAEQKFADCWSKVTKYLQKQKSRKFPEQIDYLTAISESHEPCRVCHRDDVKPGELKSLNEEEPSVLACETCRDMFELGGQLLKVQAIVRSPERDDIPDATDKLLFKLPGQKVYYHLFKYRKEIKKINKSETVFLVNDWMIYRYSTNNVVPLLLGNYARESKEERGKIMRAGEMANLAQGINRIGYLRMDVDRLGQIFANGLKEKQKQTLPRIAGLSRQMSYFFKVYLNSLAENKQNNLPVQAKYLKVNAAERKPNDPSKLLFIYAGGDDLFVSGSWNEIVEFAFDAYQSFRAYTGHNPDITLSGGISIDDAKFPLYQAARQSGKAEDAAKDNGRDSLGLFAQVFKWDEWLGITEENRQALDEKIRDYLKPDALPELLGVLPLVKKLNQLEVNYARSFIRNLLLTAEIQDKIIKENKNKPKADQQAIRYYLHLPKVAYTLARLPSRVRENADFAPVRTALKSPYNAPYFRAIATWIELLNRSKTDAKTTD